MAVTGLVLGIVSIVCSWLSSFFFPGVIGAILGIVGLVLSVQAKKQAPSGVATAGMVCSIIGLVLCVIGTATCGCVVCAAWLDSL